MAQSRPGDGHDPRLARGAQQALIAMRIEKARTVGCTALAVETLTMLEHSLRNLQRAGFEQVFDKEVYGTPA